MNREENDDFDFTSLPSFLYCNHQTKLNNIFFSYMYIYLKLIKLGAFILKYKNDVDTVKQSINL